MRGTLKRKDGGTANVRFIPAYAGNALRCSPRTSASPGSSPRMRGTQEVQPRGLDDVRFIPAYAGNAYRFPPSLNSTPVHPRVCGERRTRGGGLSASSGSSPRMRGTPRTWGHWFFHNRFIPAYAGNAGVFSSWADSETVHPRVCGERQCTVTREVCVSGSSPRMRGTRGKPRKRGGIHRFIPAYAGNACPISPR